MVLIRSKRMLEPYFRKGLIEAGCDEAGRGCLAGPVYAAAVILPSDFHHPLLNDSKQVSEKNRELLRPIIEKEAIAWQVVSQTVEDIDRVNILNASMTAMHICIERLSVMPELLLIDGKYFPPYFGIAHQCIVQGDGKFTSIAAASILAKTHRDEYMNQLHHSFPHYNWHNNKGYGSEEHRLAILKHGTTIHHRKSFKMGTEKLTL